MEWITCPSCGLKHSPRPDGLCPRCRTQVGEPGAARPLPPNPAFDRGSFDRPPSPTASQGAGEPEPMPTSPWGGGAPVPARPTSVAATLSVGSLLSRTFSTWWANVGRFAGAILLAYVPLAIAGVIAAVSVPGMMRANPGMTVQQAFLERLPIFLVFGLASFVLLVAQFGGVTFASLQHLAGKRAGIGAMYGVGFRRAWPLFASVVGAGLAIWIGLLLLVVPGVLLALGLMLIVPVVVAEDSGVGAAFSRSFALTKGSRGTLFGATVVVVLVMWAASLFSNLAMAAAATSGAAGAVLFLVSLVLQIVMAPLLHVLCAVAYHDLRVAKEGVDTSQLARVFE